MKQRLSLLLIWFFAVWGILILRGLQIQLFPSQNLKQASSKQYQRVVRLGSKRGDILDRNGEELAISVPAYSLFADPSLIKRPKILSLKLSRLLPLSQQTIYKKLSKKNSRFVWIDRLLNDETRKKILAWNEKGLGFKEEFKRIYPNKNLLAHTIGFVGADGRGLEGLEARYDSSLRDTAEELNLPKDARGRFLVEDGWLFMQERDGDDIYLTIDSNLQYYVEHELKRAILHHEADAAWAVVMDPKTSEVLAMSSQPDYDINKVGESPASARRNRVLSDIYEPGSTMKTPFIVSALQNKIVEPNTVYETGGTIKLNGHTIHESESHHVFARQNVTEILAHSSNVGIAKISLQLQDQQIYQTFLDFGFGDKVGIDLIGEGKGLLSAPPWRDHLKANISFGHGVAVTALQIANAYAAIANGGVLNRPYIVKQKRGMHGLVTVNSPHPVRRLMSSKDAEKVKMMLVAATGEGGTGRAARVKGYPVAGKTGTAQKVDAEKGGYMKGGYISSFVGFLPANDPEFLIYIVIDNPKQNGYYAADTAAPVFSRVAQYAINKRGTAPAIITADDLLKREEKVAPPVAVEMKDNVVPKMQGWTAREVLRYLKEKDVQVQMVGQSGRVIKTIPAEGEEWGETKKIKVIIE